MKTLLFIIFTEKSKNQLSSWVNIGYLVSSIKKSCEVNVLVRGYDFYEVDKAINEIKLTNADFVGVSILQENMKPCLELLTGLDRLRLNIKVILGNIEAVSTADKLFDMFKSIDVIVFGEGERTFPDLLDRLISKDDLCDCPGIYYRYLNGVKKNEPRPVIMDLDKLPFPDRSFSPDDNTLFSIIGSRGCNGNCTFCDANQIFNLQSGPKVRYRSVKNLVDEVSHLVRVHNCQYVVFVDPTFCHLKDSQNDRMSELYKEFKRRDLWVQFYFNARTEQIDETYVRKLKKLEEVGFSGLQLGLEAGNEEDLGLYGKIATLEDNIRAVTLLNKHNITFDSGFINFNPYSTINTLKQNIEFIKATNFLVRPHTLSTRLAIFSGAAITKKIKKDNLLIKEYKMGDRYPYNFISNKVDVVYKALKRAYADITINDYQWLHNLFSQYRRYSISDEKYHELVNRMDVLKEFSMNFSQWSIEILNQIIDLVIGGQDNSDEIYSMIRYRIDEINEHLKIYQAALEAIQLEVSVSLLKKGKLIIYR